MKYFAIAACLALLVPSLALGEEMNELEWETKEIEGTQRVHICYHRSLTAQWKEWGQQATAEWNKHRSETGWEFEVVPFTTDRCEVFFIARDIDESIYKGTQWTYFDTLSGNDSEPNGLVSAMVVTLDTNLELTKEWIAGEDTSDGLHDGWSVDSSEGTRDPIDAIMHNLARALRLKQSSDYTPELADEDIRDPRQNGEHYHRLSKDDIEFASKTSSSEQDIDLFTVDADEQIITSENLTLEIPAFGLGYFYQDYELIIQQVQDIAPQPLAVPEEYSHVFYAFGVFSETGINEPIITNVTYEEAWLDSQRLPLAGAEGYFAPGLVEDSIAVVKFRKEAWDLTPLTPGENPSYWNEVEIFTLNTEENIVEFEIEEPGLYGLIALPDSSTPSSHDEYTTVVNGNVIGIDGIERRLFYRRLWVATKKQLPAFILGIVFGALLMHFARPRRLHRPDKKRDSHSVPDIHGLE